jgi:hypothetical protein
MLWFTEAISLDGSAGGTSRITLDAAATSTTNRRIMRFQEVGTTRFTAGTSAWAQVLNVNFRNSHTEGSGGCVFSNESVRFTDVEFSNCESAVTGIAGALYVAAADNASTSFRPNVRLSRVTFKGNRAVNTSNNSQGGAFSGSITVESSIVGGRAFPATTNVLDAPNGVPLTAINSLFESAGNVFSAACGTNGVICNVDAKLGTLAANGGMTRTLALLVGSPAIDSGSNSQNFMSDQRMAARVQGVAVDMGAFESMPIGSTACSLDMDGAGGVPALKEGLVMVRSMLGISDADAVVGTGITPSQWSTVTANLNANCGTAGSFAP